MSKTLPLLCRLTKALVDAKKNLGGLQGAYGHHVEDHCPLNYLYSLLFFISFYLT